MRRGNAGAFFTGTTTVTEDWEKIFGEWRRLHDFGRRLRQECQNIRTDIHKLSKKFEQACLNQEKAAEYTTQLDALRQSVVAQIQQEAGLRQRQLEVELWELEELIQVHQGKRRIYLQASVRIFRILRMNDDFWELLFEMQGHVRDALESSLNLLEFYAGPQGNSSSPPVFMMAEFHKATNRLGHPYKVYQEIRQDFISRQTNLDVDTVVTIRPPQSGRNL